jgi:hypothetical protein
MSEDARRVYFVSSEALDGAAIAGQPNLYFYDADQAAGRPPSSPSSRVGRWPKADRAPWGGNRKLITPG